jgi:tetratricopeptide (TPR) repeat protein
MSKQETKKEETIVDVQQVYTNAEMFLEKNRKALTIGIGAIALILGGFFAFQFLYIKPKEAEASNAILKADLWVESDSLELAVLGNADFEGYESIAEKFSGTKVGKRAHFWTGVYYRDIKADYATALEHFKEADFDDEAIGVTVIGNIGDMHVMLGNVEEGAAWLEKAAKRANSSASRDYTGPLYHLKAAKAYMELNKNDKASTLLQFVVDNYAKNTPEFGESEKLLSYLKASE